MPGRRLELEGHRRDDLWAGHMQQKREVTDFIGQRLARQFARHGESPDQLRELDGAQSEGADHRLARRFATYKRRRPIFRERGAAGGPALDEDRPVQIVIAARRTRRIGPASASSAHLELSRSIGCAAVLSWRTTTSASPLPGRVDIWLNNRVARSRPRAHQDEGGPQWVPSISIWMAGGTKVQRRERLGIARGARPDEEAQDDADAEAIYRC